MSNNPTTPTTTENRPEVGSLWYIEYDGEDSTPYEVIAVRDYDGGPTEVALWTSVGGFSEETLNYFNRKYKPAPPYRVGGVYDVAEFYNAEVVHINPSGSVLIKMPLAGGEYGVSVISAVVAANSTWKPSH